MKKAFLFSCAAALTLAACSQEQSSSEMSEAMAEPAAADVAASADTAEAVSSRGDTTVANDVAAIPANMPQLAYDYGMAFELQSDAIGKLMRRHANVCEQQGPSSCRIVGMDLSGRAQKNDVRGKLSLAVAANHARAVTALIEDEAADAGAELASSTIGSEEVSKRVVDTEARIRAREELRDRLVEVLRTRKGSVKELIDAERSVAAVNEEIEQARAWLAETKGRVAFSRLDIDYAPPSGATSEFTAPIKGALGSLGGIFGGLIAVLIVLLAIALPVGGVIAAGMHLRRRLVSTPAG
jgi:ribosomal protein L10